MGQNDLTDYITDYYKHLYALGANVAGTKKAQELCWLSVPLKVAKDTNSFLTQKLTLAEVLNAIHALPKGKAPGHDNVPMEFFHECAQDVAPDLLNAFTAMLKAGETSPFINKGQITLIPKLGDQARFDNWRSITLLGSLYKILVKVLARRVQIVFPHVIRPN